MPVPSRTRSTSRSSAGRRGDGRIDPITLNRDTASPAGQRGDHTDRQVVAPVQVLHRDQHRPISGQLLDQVDAGLDDGVAEVFDHISPTGDQQLVQPHPGRSAGRRHGEQPVGHDTGTARQLVGRHLHHGHPDTARHRRRLAHEMGLADPGLTLDQDHPPDPDPRRGDQLTDQRQLGDPPDGRRRRLGAGVLLGRPQPPTLGEPSQPAPSTIEEPDRR